MRCVFSDFKSEGSNLKPPSYGDPKTRIRKSQTVQIKYPCIRYSSCLIVFQLSQSLCQPTMLLVRDKNYFWLFAVLAVCVIVSRGVAAATVGGPLAGTYAIPLAALFLLVSQWRSGVALNASWNAEYPKGTWQFFATCVAWAFFCVVATIVLRP